MKFFRKIGVLLILFVVSLTIETCINCKCPKIKSFEYSISSFNIIQSDLIGINVPPECRKDFAIWFVFETENTAIANCKPVNSLFMQSAYACDCSGDMYYPKDKIVSIQVFSDKDFDETHPAGSDIAEFFKIRELGNYIQNQWQLTLVSFESYFEYPPQTFSGSPHIEIPCVLTATTIEAGEYEFIFVFKLSDERTLEQSMKSVLE